MMIKQIRHYVFVKLVTEFLNFNHNSDLSSASMSLGANDCCFTVHCSLLFMSQ